jgi:Protein of unknown function (DUF3606)
MRQSKVRSVRNTLDIADANQVRALKKRFRLSEAELAEIVDKIGNSIAAIGKEVARQRAGELSGRPNAQPAVVASVSVPAPTHVVSQKG